MRQWLSGLLAIGLLAGFALAADDAGIPKLKKEIKEEGDQKLNWVWQPLVADSLLFLSVHRSGTINIYSRDTATGDIKYLSAIPLAADLGSPGRHLDPHMAFVSKLNIIYAAGEWTHAGSDKDNIGLSWYQVDPKDGLPKKQGKIACSAGVLYLSPDPSVLHLAAKFLGEAHTITLAADGTPTVGDVVKGKGLGKTLLYSPDNKFVYSAAAGGTLAWMECSAEGKLKYVASLALPDAPGGEPCLFMSPDGKHVYVTLSRYGQKEAAFGAILNRDAKTGALTLAETFAMREMVGAERAVVSDDGKSVYVAAGPECPASGLSCLKRDLDTGRLTFVSKVRGVAPTSFLAYDPKTATIYTGGSFSRSGFAIVGLPKD